MIIILLPHCIGSDVFLLHPADPTVLMLLHVSSWEAEVAAFGTEGAEKPRN